MQLVHNFQYSLLYIEGPVHVYTYRLGTLRRTMGIKWGIFGLKLALFPLDFSIVSGENKTDFFMTFDTTWATFLWEQSWYLCWKWPIIDLWGCLITMMQSFIKNIKLHIVTDIKVIVRNAICHEKSDTLTTFCGEKCQDYKVRGNQRVVLTRGHTKESRDTLEKIKGN